MSIDHLKGYIAEPTIQRAALTAVESADGPMTAREVADAIGVRVQAANLALTRLTHKRALRRWKVPMTRRARYVGTYPTFLYEPNEETE